MKQDLQSGDIARRTFGGQFADDLDLIARASSPTAGGAQFDRLRNDPEEGRRLIKAFSNIRDKALRSAILRVVERLAPAD